MNRFSRDFETKFGMAVDDKLEQKVKITLLATGFGIKDVPGMDNMMNKRTIEEQKKLEELEEEEQRKDRTSWRLLRQRHLQEQQQEETP